MIITLYGSDTYRSREKLKEIILNYRAKNKTGVNFHRFDETNFDWDEFKNVFKAGLMFKEKKLVVLDGVLASKKTDLDEWLEFIKAAGLAKDEGDFLIILEEKLPAAASKFLAKAPARIQEFEELAGASLVNWIKTEFGKMQSVPTAQAIKKLIDFFGSDAWRLSQEIKKLALAGRHIDAKDVEELTKPNLDPNVFEAIDALGYRNKAKALKIFHEHLENGEEAGYLLAMIAYQLRLITQIKKLESRGASFADIARRSGLKPFVVKKTLPMAQKFTHENLKSLMNGLFETDLAVKGGQIKGDLALDLFVTSF